MDHVKNILGSQINFLFYKILENNFKKLFLLKINILGIKK